MHAYAERTHSFQRSDIRELLRLTAQKDIISFAGGLPSPEAFPVETIRALSQTVLDEDYESALQYGTTEGMPRLRQSISRYMARSQGAKIDADEVIVTTGAQQAIELISVVYIDKGSQIVVEKPSYIGALASFSMFQAEFIGVELDGEGMRMDMLREAIKGNSPKFIYTVPTFQNPAGVTMGTERRKELIEIANENDLLIVEDNPYGELVYSGKHPLSLKSLDTEGRVLYLGTLSKMLSPGFRIGWVAGDKEILDKLSMAKQGTDLCTNTFAQHVAYRFMDSHMDAHIEKIKRIYSAKCALMLESMDRFLPREKLEWTRPAGGMFVWATLPKGMHGRELLKLCIGRHKVAFVPGDAFFCDGSNHHTLRLNYTYPSDAQIPEGIARLSRGIGEMT